MEVAAYGGHQPVLFACFEHLLGHVRGIGLGVIDLQAVDACRNDRRQELAPIAAVKLVVVRPRSDAADRVDQPDAFRRLEAKALEVGRTIPPDEAFKGLVDRLNVASLE